MSATLLEVRDLRTHFVSELGTVRAVDGASFTLEAGQTLGIVGESGCGKSIMSRSILGIVPHPGAVVGGEIRYHRDGETLELTALDPKGAAIRAIRGAEIAMVFQEPMTSLSPVHTIGEQIGEVIRLHHMYSKAAAQNRAIEALDLVGMPRPADIVKRYPHQLSGGMRQRAMIAMALSCSPRLLIADEPTTALDVTTQAQILALLRRLQAELGMAILFITHDLGVIAQMTDQVIVMYMGRIVEAAAVDALFYQPRHPYTSALLHSIPRLGSSQPGEKLNVIRGSIPDPYAVPGGCPFHNRCLFNDGDRCQREAPQLREVAPGQFASCHYAGDLALAGIAGDGALA